MVSQNQLETRLPNNSSIKQKNRKISIPNFCFQDNFQNQFYLSFVACPEIQNRFSLWSLEMISTQTGYWSLKKTLVHQAALTNIQFSCLNGHVVQSEREAFTFPGCPHGSGSLNSQKKETLFSSGAAAGVQMGYPRALEWDYGMSSLTTSVDQ